MTGTDGLDADAVANRWYDSIRDDNLIELPRERVVSQLAGHLRRLGRLLESGEDATGARRIGAELVSLGWDRPRLLSQSLRLLGEALQEGVAPADRIARQPRVAELLGELSTGFFAAQSAELARRNRAYLRSVGHDLVAPLNAVVGFARLLLNGFSGPLEESQREDIAGILEAGGEMTTLIREVMAVSKGEGGAVTVERESVPLRPLVEELVEGTLAIRRRRGIALEVDWSRLPETIVTDPDKLRFILRTLLSYSTWLSPGTTLELAAFATGAGEEHLCFEIGPLDLTTERATAMIDAVLEIDDAGSQPHASDALGLAHARFLVTRLGGTLDISDGPDVGSSVRLCLPS